MTDRPAEPTTEDSRDWELIAKSANATIKLMAEHAASLTAAKEAAEERATKWFAVWERCVDDKDAIRKLQIAAEKQCEELRRALERIAEEGTHETVERVGDMYSKHGYENRTEIDPLAQIAIEALASTSPNEGTKAEKQWRCFHCGEVFSDDILSRHLGPKNPASSPKEAT